MLNDAETNARFVRIGVIGAGSRLRNVLDKLTLAQGESLNITAVYDPDKQSVEALRANLAPDVAVCDTAENLCARSDVDWVFIGSWNSFHADQVCKAFAAGKHVFCEKPLALSVDEARAMYRAWKASKRIFALGLVLRYSPLYRKAKQLLEDNVIGDLVSFEFNETLSFNHGGYIHGNWRRKRENAGTHLLEKCCHDLDLALWLTNGKPIRVASFGNCSFFKPENSVIARKIGNSPENGRPAYRAWDDPTGIDPFNDDKDIVDNQVAVLEFVDDVRATFHTNCNAGLPERRFYMVGTEGTLRFDAMSGCIELRQVGWSEPSIIYSVTEGSSHAGGDELMAKELLEVLCGRCAPKAGFAEGIRSLVLANAIDRAMEVGSVVDLKSEWNSLENEFGPLFPGRMSRADAPANQCELV